MQELAGPHVNIPSSAEEESSETIPESDLESAAETLTES